MVQFLLQNYETILKNYLPIAMGRDDGGQVVIIAYDQSSNPAEVHNFSVRIVVEEDGNKQKEAGVGAIF